MNKLLKKHAKNGIPGFENESLEKQQKELTRMYRTVFSSEEGQIVLATILEDLHFYTPCHSDDERALNNYAKHLISNRLGIANSFDKTESLLNCGLEE